MTEIRAAALSGSRILLHRVGERLTLPTERALLEAAAEQAVEPRLCEVRIPTTAGPSVRVYDLPEDWEATDDAWALSGLREAYFVLGEEEFRIAGTARQKVEWLRTHTFCSRCGAATSRHHDHEAMWCAACGHLQFARLAPAVIVLVQREDETLLARSPHFPAGLYSTLAGFVEPGESLEECVHREVEEEVGVRVRDLRYFGSQSHPFPHSLMVGYVAEWASGDIRIDPSEIQDAAWFSADELPKLPHPMSIARALIEDFVERTHVRRHGAGDP